MTGMQTRHDFLRIEHFGGFYYSRETRQTTALPHEYADFLLQTTLRPATRVLETEAKDSFPTIRRLIQPTLDDWRTSGVLDEEFRCRARVVRNHPPVGVLGAPVATSFEITERCNLRCMHCYVDRRTSARREVTPTALAMAFEELERAGSPAITLSGGEPLIRRDVWEILDRAMDRQLDVKFCTNATQIDRPVAQRLVRYPIHTYSVSLDGPTAEVHDSIRGTGNFDRVFRGVKALRDAGAPNVMLRITVTARNIDNLAGYATVGDIWPVDAISFRPFRFNGAAREPALVVSRPSYDRAVRLLERRWQGKARGIFGSSLPTRSPGFAPYIPRFGCNGGNGTLSVKADGSVVACATVRTPDEWNLERRGLLECWYGAPSIQRWREIQAPDECLRCNELDRCGGGCRARAQSMGRGLGGADPWCCPRMAQRAISVA